MKLRNKNTGKNVILRNKISGKIVKDYKIWINSDFSMSLIIDGFELCYYSREQFMNEWEDYEKPKGIQGVMAQDESVVIRMSSIEEAEKAVKKLKAWQRLKDKGFKFYGWNKGSLLKGTPNNITFACDDTRKLAWEDIQEDLDLLFGGEE